MGFFAVSDADLCLDGVCCLIDMHDSGDIFLAVSGFSSPFFLSPSHSISCAGVAFCTRHKADAGAGLSMPSELAQHEAA